MIKIIVGKGINMRFNQFLIGDVKGFPEDFYVFGD
jgi:hypothetical protein